ncbi:hypothetical protein PVAND_012561 [Polypedilum vanderplanki]|uniref:Protein HIRA n=1 Tax=Polypedilum vanderplanki TaxID=319348 RepID=A0A9J6CN34_POLVA|nr:hypothetical protein PVAND_012561 [Polypedilum vanderplanki]
MKLLKPAFVHNQDRPIFSIDIHPKEPKFATGGQGNDSGSVIIWNLEPVLSEKAEMDPKVPKILCQIDNHLSCVNAVRWSSNGLMLASGADDKLIMIWKRFGGAGSNFGSSGMAKNVENWRCTSTLRGHSGDVLDLAWSPQDRWLASCSVDNSIIIWDAQAFPTIIATLKGHTGLVKGVTWDPVGKYIASQSDDRSVKIWKTSDWTIQNTITEPFEECGGTTHILRLSWSPDGQYLVSAHAMNGGGPTSQIIERDGWKCDKDFVGHRKAVTCVRFHNSILKKQSQKTNKTQQYCCLAIGSRDRCLSVWMTALQRPLLVIRDLFEDSILDLSWSSDGYTLLACSGDGTVACLQFTEDQLGKPLSDSDKNSLYQRMYGKDATLDLSTQAEKELIIESAELLNVVQDNKRGPPTLIPTTPKETSVAIAASNITKPPVPQISSSSVTTTTNSSPNKPILKQVETRRADGKRRITPMFIPLNSESSNTNAESTFSSSSQNRSQIVIESSSVQDSTEIQSTPTVISSVSKPTPTTEPLKLDTRLSFRDTPQKSQGSLASTSMASPATTTNVTQKSSVPIVRMNSGKAVALTGGQCVKIINDYRIQVINDAHKTNFGSLSRVVCMNVNQQQQVGDRKLWEVTVGSAVSSFSVCSKYVLIGAMDGSVRLIHIKSGMLVVPVLNQASPILLSGFSPNSLLGGIVTERALLCVWNVDKAKIHLRTSCVDVIDGNGFLNLFYVTDEGIPFVGTSAGSAYSYSVDLQSWMIVNSSDSLTRCGLHGSITNIKNMKSYPVATVQYISNSFQQKTKNPVEISDDVWEAQTKISFAEHQIQLCQLVNSPVELKYWYSNLGYYLASHGNEKKVRQVLDDLLGPIYSLENDAECRAKHKILNIDKHELLREVLTSFHSSTKWQRIYCEYTDQLNEMEAPKKKLKMDTS